MLFFEWNGEAVDDTSEDLEQFSDTVVPVRFVHEAVKYIRNRFPNKATVAHEFAIDAVQNSFKVVALTGIFTVKELDELEAEWLIGILLACLRVHFRRHDKAQEKLVHHLQKINRINDVKLFILGSSKEGGMLRKKKKEKEIGKKESIA